MFWCQWIDLSLTAMKIFHLFCICDDRKNSVKCLQYGSDRIFFSSLSPRVSEEIFARGKKGFPGSKQNGLFKGRPTVGKFTLTNSELIWKFSKHAWIKFVLRIYQTSKFREYKFPPLPFRRSCLSASASVYVVIVTWTTPSPSAPTISIARWTYGRKTEDCARVWSKHAETETLLTRGRCDYVE